MAAVERLADFLRTKIAASSPPRSVPAALVGGRVLRIPSGSAFGRPFPRPAAAGVGWLRGAALMKTRLLRGNAVGSSAAVSAPRRRARAHALGRQHVARAASRERWA